MLQKLYLTKISVASSKILKPNMETALLCGWEYIVLVEKHRSVSQALLTALNLNKREQYAMKMTRESPKASSQVSSS